MIGKVDPRLNLTLSQVITKEEKIQDLACLVIIVALTLFITGYLCVICKIYEDPDLENDQPEDTTAQGRKKPKALKPEKSSTQPNFLKAPNNTPIRSTIEEWI